MPLPPSSRRAEYAEATSAAIVKAARDLFSQQGYFATKVEDIARRARVAPATVYAVGGGKRGLLTTLVDLWSQAQIVTESLRRQERLTEPDEILRQTAATVRSMREDYGDIMRVVLDTAPHHPGVSESLRTATARYRDAVAAVATRLSEVGGLQSNMTTDEATDILWFYFGYSGYFTLIDDNSWSLDKSERWLVQQASKALRTAP